MSKVKSVDQVDILDTYNTDEQTRAEQSTSVGGSKTKKSSKNLTPGSESSDGESDLESVRSVASSQDRRNRRMSRSRSRSRSQSRNSRAHSLVRPLSSAEESENDEPKYKRSVGYRDNLHRMIRPISLVLDKAQPKKEKDAKQFNSARHELSKLDRKYLANAKERDDKHALDRLLTLEKQLDVNSDATRIALDKLKMQCELLTNAKFRKDPEISKKKSIQINAEYPGKEPPDRNVRDASKAVKDLFTPVINKNGLRRRDNTIVDLLLTLNEKAHEYSLTEKQQMELLFNIVPNGPLKEEMRLSHSLGLQAVYDVLCAMNPAIDSLQELDTKLHNWRLIPGKGLGDSVSQLIQILSAMEREKISPIEKGNKDLLKELLLKMFGRIVESTSYKLRNKLLAKIQAIRETKPEHLATLAEYQSQLHELCQRAQAQEFKPQNKVNSKYELNQLEYTMVGNVKDQISNLNEGLEHNSVDHTLADHENTIGLEVQAMEIHPRGHSLQDRADFLRRRNSEQPNNWKPKSAMETWVPVFEGPMYTDSSKKTLSSQLMKHFDRFCYKCGHFSHVGKHCRLYEGQPLAYSLCMRCKQGFHTVCFSVRKDLQQKDRYVADLAAGNITNNNDPATELNISMNRLNQTIQSTVAAGSPNGTDKQLHRQVNASERKIKVLEETQSRTLEGINEIRHMLGTAYNTDPS